jgi:hypothetical protein
MLLDLFSDNPKQINIEMGIFNEAVTNKLLNNMPLHGQGEFLVAPEGLDHAGLGANGDIVFADPSVCYPGDKVYTVGPKSYTPLALIDLKHVQNYSSADRATRGKSIYTDELNAPVFVLHTGINNMLSTDSQDTYSQMLTRIRGELQNGTSVNLAAIPEKDMAEALLKEKIITEMIRTSFNLHNLNQLDLNRHFSNAYAQEQVENRVSIFKAKMQRMAYLLGVSPQEMQTRQDNFIFKSKEKQPRVITRFV